MLVVPNALQILQRCWRSHSPSDLVVKAVCLNVPSSMFGCPRFVDLNILLTWPLYSL